MSIAFGAAGCHLIEQPLSLTRLKRNSLPPIRMAGDAISLEIVFVDRPAGDALLGAPLWSHVDQVASLDSAVRAMLRQNGLRVGIVCSNPPESLQTMLGLNSRESRSAAKLPDQSSGLEGRRVSLPAGGTTEVHVSPFYEHTAEQADLTVVQGAEKRTRHYVNCRCVYQLTARRLQDGWVQLDFLPQVHHGDHYLRPTAGTEDWQFDQGQRVDTFHPQRFTLPLNEGEIAIVTVEDSTRESLGELFFRERSSAATIQRLLLVRLCDAGSASPVYGVDS
jgi:hypothetical protein